jgi:hypothetical protein
MGQLQTSRSKTSAGNVPNFGMPPVPARPDRNGDASIDVDVAQEA